jgi:nicotinamidase/pyrazinamidase
LAKSKFLSLKNVFLINVNFLWGQQGSPVAEPIQPQRNLRKNQPCRISTQCSQRPALKKGEGVMNYRGMMCFCLVVSLIFILLTGGSAIAKDAKDIGIIVVDVQGDFTQYMNGSLAVEGTDAAYVKAVEETTKKFKAGGYPIYATQDWHPADHSSFFTNHAGKKPFDLIQLHGKDQVLWPPHCIQNTSGADILLDSALFTAVVQKGMDTNYDSYSGFQDDGGKKTGMDDTLKKHGITKVVVYGIATDYCVHATAVDAADAGYKVIMINSLSRGVAPDTSRKALDNLTARGILVLEDIDMEKITAF